MERAARERAFLIIGVSSKEFDWWENHSGGHRLPAGSIELGSCLTKREAILPEDHFYEDPQLERLRLAHAASLQAASHDGLRPQVCPRVHSQAERLASGGERTSTRLSLKNVLNRYCSLMGQGVALQS